MSEYHVVKVKITDGECLVKALQELQIPFENHSVPQRLYGFEGKLRQQKANIIIRKEHVGDAANDVGFLKTDKGWEMVISEYDIPRREIITKTLMQSYGKIKSLKALKSAGCFSIKTTKTSQGLKIKACY